MGKKMLKTSVKRRNLSKYDNFVASFPQICKFCSISKQITKPKVHFISAFDENGECYKKKRIFSHHQALHENVPLFHSHTSFTLLIK